MYVWNLWVFRHEILQHGHLPFTTEHIFAFTGGADFSLHNYTPIAGLFAFPLIPHCGVVGAFNLVLMLMLALSGAGLYGLGRYAGLRPVTAWLAGALFMSAPLISARETAHLSLVTNAALPLFVWSLLGVLDRPSRSNGALLGVVVAAATYSDAYYGVFCVLMGLFVIGWRLVRVETTRGASFRWEPLLDSLIVMTLLIASVPAALGVSRLRIGALDLRDLDHPYTPLLACVALIGVRLWVRLRPAVSLAITRAELTRLVICGLLAVGTCLALLSPLLIGIAERYASGRLPDTHIFWRSSPRGVDLLAYLVPNPTHVWMGRWSERWLLPDVQDAFPELVASFSIVAIAALMLAAAQRIIPKMWTMFTALFVALSLGPFIHIGGTNTYVIGPWALLRYVPIIGMARSPSRFAIVAAMGLSLLCAFAVQSWVDRRRQHTRFAVSAFVCLLAVEMIPGPRRLFSAEVPDVYRMVAVAGDEDGSLLELPTGIRDGTSSLGNFSASTSYFQTRHGRPLIGGYLSRVSEWRKRESLRAPMLRALYQLSGPGGTLDEQLEEEARASREAFFGRSCVRFVLIDKRAAREPLRVFAREALRLSTVFEDERYELLVPNAPPACKAEFGHSAASRPRLASH